MILILVGGKILSDVIGSAYHCQKKTQRDNQDRREMTERQREVTRPVTEISTYVQNSADEQALKKKRSQSGNPTHREVKKLQRGCNVTDCYHVVSVSSVHNYRALNCLSIDMK